MAGLFFKAGAAPVDDSYIFVSINTEGKIIDYIDPAAWGQNGEYILRNVNHAFKYMPVPRKDLATIKSVVEDTTDKYRVDYNAMEDTLADDKWAENFHDGKSEIILPKEKKYTDLIKLKSAVSNPIIEDRFTWSIGDSTVGSGGSYATLAVAWDDVAATFTGGCTTTVVSSIEEVATARITENNSTYDIIVRSDSPHNGDVTAGYLISVNIGNGYCLWFNNSGTGKIVVQDLRFKRTGTPSSNYTMVLIYQTSSASAIVNDCFFDGNSKTEGVGLQLSDASTKYEAYNSVFYDFIGTGDGALLLSVIGGSSEIENCNFHNCSLAVNNGDVAMVFDNCLFSSNDANFLDNTNSISNNCATDAVAVGAATDNNAVTEITIGDEVVSTDKTSPYFLKLKDGSLDGAGGAASITENTLGIRGNTMASPPSIGADELWVATYDTNYSDTIYYDSVCVGIPDSLQATQGDSVRADSINWTDTITTVTFREIGDLTVYDALGFCPSDSEVFRMMKFRKRSFRNQPFDKPEKRLGEAY